MKQSSHERSLYLRELRKTLNQILMPELKSSHAQDCAACMDRILTLFILEEEQGEEIGRICSDDMRGNIAEAFAALAQAGAGISLHDGISSSPSNIPPPAVQASGFHDLRDRAQQLIPALLGAGSTGARDLANRMFACEHRFLSELTARRNAIKASSDPDSTDSGAAATSISPELMTSYLRSRLPGDPNIEVAAITLIPGGRSKETLLLDIRSSTTLAAQVIMRKDMPVGVVDSRACEEFALLRVVHAAGVPVPEPYLVEHDAQRLGGTFIIVEKLPGSKQGEYFPDVLSPPHNRRKIATQLARILARIHSIPLEQVIHAGLKPNTNLKADLESRLESLHARFRDVEGPPSVSIALAVEWLGSHLPDVALDGCTTLVHGDVGLHNLTIDETGITGIIDWENAMIGSPAIDLARCRHTIDHLSDWSEFRRSYLDAGGLASALNDKAIRFYRIMTQLGGAVASRYGGHLFRSGTKRDLVAATSGYDHHYRACHLLADALHEALSCES